MAQQIAACKPGLAGLSGSAERRLAHAAADHFEARSVVALVDDFMLPEDL